MHLLPYAARQEAVELSAQNLGAGAAGPIAGSAILWEAAITRALRSSTDVDAGALEQVVCRQMMGIVLLLFVRRSLLPVCSAPRACSVGTGLLGLVGNKGAVAASMRVHSSTLCFVCAHMASGASAVEARNLEYAQLLSRLAFSAVPPAHDGDAPLPETVMDHDCVAWFGDLNYRINMEAGATRTLAEAADYEALRAHDQLLDAQRNGHAFEAFIEAPLAFAPTYKYDPQSDTFDTSEKRRPPAWCDRILWRAPSASEACCSEYTRHDERTSDHRPVSARLTFPVAVADDEARERVRQEIIRSLDAWENSCVPSCTLDGTEFSFGSLTWAAPTRQALSITNSGQTALQFSFERLPDAAGGGVCASRPPFLGGSYRSLRFHAASC